MDQVEKYAGHSMRNAAASYQRKVRRSGAPGAISFFLSVLFLLTTPAPSQGPDSRSATQASEYDVKAAFLLNFTKFIEWPSYPSPPDEPFTICIFGADPFGTPLDQLVEGERISQRRVAVRRTRDLTNWCEVLFISKSERGVAQTLSHVRRGVLTVGETDDFIRQGGMIAFTIENRRVRFDVDERIASRAGLKISSKLLNVARSVERALP